MIEVYTMSINKYYITNKLICQLKFILDNKKFPDHTSSLPLFFNYLLIAL